MGQEATARTGYGLTEGSKLERSMYNKAVYGHPAYLTSMKSISCEMSGCMSHKLNQDCWEKHQQPQICR